MLLRLSDVLSLQRDPCLHSRAAKDWQETHCEVECLQMSGIRVYLFTAVGRLVVVALALARCSMGACWVMLCVRGAHRVRMKGLRVCLCTRVCLRVTLGGLQFRRYACWFGRDTGKVLAAFSRVLVHSSLP